MVRAGGPRKTADFSDLAQEILTAWNRIINNGKKGHGEYELKVVTIQASITAALESGFHVPQVRCMLQLNRTMPEDTDLRSSGRGRFYLVEGKQA